MSGVKPVMPELGFPSSEPGRSHSMERMSTVPDNREDGVSFDLPAQADTLHNANKVMKPFFFLAGYFKEPHPFFHFFLTLLNFPGS